MIYGVFTNTGIAKTIDAANNEGFYIYPTEFGVSDVIGVLSPTRTDPNAGEFYRAAISTRIVVNQNTVKFVCTIPQAQTLISKNVKEVYLYAKDSLNNDFLLALGQPSETLVYDPDGTLSLELQVALVDIDLTANYIFNNTQATELAEHKSDPNAHPELYQELARAGIVVKAGAIAFENRGQNYEADIEFDGTKAVKLAGGINFSSLFNGTEGNSISLVFDGIKTVDQVVGQWNIDNPNNQAVHDGLGTEVLAAQTVDLLGGTYLVDDGDNVYADVDGIYKKAIADGSNKTNAIARANVPERLVVFRGLFDTVVGYPTGTILYLSSTVAGGFSDINNGVSLGIVKSPTQILYTGFSGSANVESSQTFDAVVTGVTGLGFFETTQLAINNVPNFGRILINKLEELKATIDTQGKTLDLVFNGTNTGWTRFLGEKASFLIEFSDVPDAGTFRMEWNAQESADMPFSSTALDIQTEFNLFSGHTGVTVTGDFTSGFLFEFADEVPQPAPTFLYAGHNEIQRFDFSNIPDNGTITFEHDGNPTINYAWNDDQAQLKAALEALASITNLTVRGTFAEQYFELEFDGGILQDGLQPRNNITVIASTLLNGLTQTLVNGIDPSVGPNLPILPNVLQQGKYPASNLRNGVTPIDITVTQVSAGQAIGPDKAIILDAPNIHITGYGVISEFIDGVDVNGQDGSIIETLFTNVTNPVLAGDRKPGVNIDTSNILGFAKDLFSQLKITEHPTDKKKVKISGADEILASGVVLSQELNSLLLDFDGAEIDFSTGEIFKADGVTPLGQNFTPIVPAAEQFRWASITLIPSVEAADGRITAQVLVLFASEDGVSKELAKKAAFAGGKPLGQVALEGDLGETEITRIVAIRDQFLSLDGKYFIIEDEDGTVAGWMDLTGTTVEPIHGADRSIRILAAENDGPNAIALAIQTAFDADSKFSATVSDNRTFITCLALGSRTDAFDVDTGFFFTVMQQGRDTDITGLVDIKNSSIFQLGVGSGSGSGGSNNEDSLRYQDRLNLSPFNLAHTNIAATDEDAQFDVVSTATYDLTASAFKFADSTAQTLQSLQQLDEDYLSLGVDLEKIEFCAIWNLNGNDPVGTVYSASRDGGNNWQVLDLSRVGNSDFYRVVHDFTDEPSNAFSQEYAVANADALKDLNATSVQSVSNKFTVSETTVFKNILAYINKNQVMNVGGFYLEIVRDDAGSPSINPDDSIWISKRNPISDLAVGNNVANISMQLVLVAGDYHLNVLTDAEYKDAYTNDANDKISVRMDSSAGPIPNLRTFDGLVWSAEVADESMVYRLEGRVLDLRIKITSPATAGDKSLSSYAIFYQYENGIEFAKPFFRQVFKFDGTVDNLNEFLLEDFLPDSRLLMCFALGTGQVFRYGDFVLDGRKVIFPQNTFNVSGMVRLEFLQLQGIEGKVSPSSDALVTANFLGSTDATIDRSLPGRGHIFQNENGDYVEVGLDAFNNWKFTIL